MDGRIAAANVTNISLEVLDVDDVEANDGGEEAHVDLGQLFAKIIGTLCFGEMLLDGIQCREEGVDCRFIG